MWVPVVRFNYQAMVTNAQGCSNSSVPVLVQAGIFPLIARYVCNQVVRATPLRYSVRICHKLSLLTLQVFQPLSNDQSESDPALRSSVR